MALVLHPHPQQGGTMHNKVVYALYQCFVRRGFSTLRFNFRGVGRSQGSFDRGEGELSDAAAALDWMQTYNPNAGSCWVAGFSFGAWIGMQLLMRRPEIESFISVAPPANLYDFTFLAPCPSSGLILQGDQDLVVPVEAVQKLVTKLSHQRDIKIDFRKIPGADHDFADRVRRPRHSRRRLYRQLRRRHQQTTGRVPGPRHPLSQSANGSRIRTVSSRSGLVDSRATGAPISSSSRLMYLIAVAGRSAQDRAPRVLSRQPSAVS